MNYNKLLYIFFIVLSLNIFFFSTTKLKAKAFLIEDIEVSQILENDFNKDFLINKGFEKAFYELIETLLKSSDQKKIQNIKSNEILFKIVPIFSGLYLYAIAHLGNFEVNPRTSL